MAFLGASEETWRFVNTFAPWFSAAGTVSAVVVSLWLARSQQRTRLSVSVGPRVIVGPGMVGPTPEFVAIFVANLASRPVRIINIGWRVGLFRKRYVMQNASLRPLSSPLPIELAYGQDAKWMFP